MLPRREDFKLTPLPFFSGCVLHVVRLINRIPFPVIYNRNPFELLCHSAPSYNHHRVFGCLTYASTLPSHQLKFDPRAKKCIFLGYSPRMKGYKLYDLTRHSIFVSRDVVFYEKDFPFRNLSAPLSNLSLTSSSIDDSFAVINVPSSLITPLDNRQAHPLIPQFSPPVPILF